MSSAKCTLASIIADQSLVCDDDLIKLDMNRRGVRAEGLSSFPRA